MMPDNAATQAVNELSSSGSSSIQALFWIGAGMQAMGSSALRIMSLMVRTMQIALHMPAMALYVPSNVMMFFYGLLPIVCWDMLDGFISWETLGLIVTQEEEAPFPGQLEELGYESSNFIMNTQTISLFLFILTAYILLLVMLKSCLFCCKCCETD